MHRHVHELLESQILNLHDQFLSKLCYFCFSKVYSRPLYSILLLDCSSNSFAKHYSENRHLKSNTNFHGYSPFLNIFLVTHFPSNLIHNDNDQNVLQINLISFLHRYHQKPQFLHTLRNNHT